MNVLIEYASLTNVLDDNRATAERCGAIEVIVDAMRAHTGNADVCKSGCAALWNISERSCYAQKSICEKGGLSVLLEVLRKYDDNQNLLELCCSVIGIILSSQETRSKFCATDVLHAVRECSERHSDNEKIKNSYLSLIGKEGAGGR